MHNGKANPTLKFNLLPDEQVLTGLHQLAIDAQWKTTNSKSPEKQREHQTSLNLFGSAVEMIKRMKHSDDVMSIFDGRNGTKEGEQSND